MKRVCEGSRPFKVAASFPGAVRPHWNDYRFYIRGQLPFDCSEDV